MSTSDKIPATDRSQSGPGSSHVGSGDKTQDSAGAHHQNKPADAKHPKDDARSAHDGNKHERRKPGEGGRA